MLLPTNYKMKPPTSAGAIQGHPLAKGLVGCWLFNEGAGRRAFDSSANKNHSGDFNGLVNWSRGKLGACLDFAGSNDYFDIGYYPNPSSGTIVYWFNLDVSSTQVIGSDDGAGHKFFAGVDWAWDCFWGAGDTQKKTVASGLGAGDIGTWHMIAITADGSTSRFYLDGVEKDSFSYSFSGTSSDAFRIGELSSGIYDVNGRIDHLIIWERPLSKSEIGLLYREPFAMFTRAARPELMYAPVSLAGSVQSKANLSANITILPGEPFEKRWLSDALFAGMTANAFKLGTVLTLGWFWTRVEGCSALYRGGGMGDIDFANILAVAETDAATIEPPAYARHNSESTYFYVVRRFNSCGYQELTLGAAVKVEIDANGDIADARPNRIFESRIEQVEGGKIELVWYYCPVEQKAEPASSHIYYDNGTGQIDYENAIATIEYQGRRFYSYLSDTLNAGEYLFAIRARGADGVEDRSLAQVRIQIRTKAVRAIDILSAQAV